MRIKLLPGLTSSTALHQLEQLKEDHGNLDYAFLSPIFDSISKAGYNAAFADHEQLRAAVAASPVPLYALGGNFLFTSSLCGVLARRLNCHAEPQDCGNTSWAAYVGHEHLSMALLHDLSP